jgi:acyl-CoA synthetase (AMP-forming)/AMP-acid ligase II/acyl carrier protein
MFTVYGLAEASLAMTFPSIGGPFEATSFRRGSLGVGQRAEVVSKDDKEAVELMALGKAINYSAVQIAGDDDAPLSPGHVGNVYIRGENVTKGYFENPEANAAALTKDGWLRTGDLGLIHNDSLYISGRAKEIIFVNGQNYYPHDLESIAQRAEGLELGKVVAAGAQRKGEQTEKLVVFVLHRSDMNDFLPVASQVSRLINENTGVEVGEVVPVKRIPKTTSGKIQRHLLEESYVQGEFDVELAELAALRDALRGPATSSRSAIEDQLKTIVDSALQGKRVDLHDNLFEVGASSLKLIEIHENIDREYPGLVDLTELFDFPTVAELAQHLEGKLAAQA